MINQMWQGWWWQYHWMMRPFCRRDVITPFVWQIIARQMWIKENPNRKWFQHQKRSLINSIETYASVALRFKFNPLLLLDEKPPSFDKKMSQWASVGLWCISITLISLCFTYCREDCLLTLAKLLTSRCKVGKWDRRNGRTFGRSGKLVVSCTAAWNSSIAKPPLCWKFKLE